VCGAHGPGFSIDGVLVRSDGREYPIPPAGLTIGRRSDAGVPVQDPEVSRSHARVRRRDGSFIVVDLGSANGTYLNDHRVTDEAPMADGDILRTGNCLLTFRLRRPAVGPDADAGRRPAPSEPDATAPPAAYDDAGTMSGRARSETVGAVEIAGPGMPRLTTASVELSAGPHGPAATVHLQGVLDIETVGLLDNQTTLLLQRGVVHFILDLADLEYLDSSGLAALVALRRQVDPIDGTVRLQHLQPAVRNILVLTRLDRLFILE
jgi:anti-anti-sigma factor